MHCLVMICRAKSLPVFMEKSKMKKLILICLIKIERKKTFEEKLEISETRRNSMNITSVVCSIKNKRDSILEESFMLSK